MVKQLQDIITKNQKKNDFNIKKSLQEEVKTTATSGEVVGFLKPFIQVLINEIYHQKNRLRLLYNLTDRAVKIFTKHYSKFTVTTEGAILLGGDINRYNELFL